MGKNEPINKPHPTSKLLSVAIVAFAAAFLLVLFVNRPDRDISSKLQGQQAPELDLVLLVGEPPAGAVTTDEGLAKRTGTPPALTVTLLHFWGTWCPPCVAEYPHLAELYHEKKSTPGFEFVSVSCESGPGETLPGIREKTLKFYDRIQAGEIPTYVDAQGTTRENVKAALGERSMVYPTTVLIGPDQRIAGAWRGYSEAALGEMRRMIDELMKQAG